MQLLTRKHNGVENQKLVQQLNCTRQKELVCQ